MQTSANQIDFDNLTQGLTFFCWIVSDPKRSVSCVFINEGYFNFVLVCFSSWNKFSVLKTSLTLDSFDSKFQHEAHYSSFVFVLNAYLGRTLEKLKFKSLNDH